MPIVRLLGEVNKLHAQEREEDGWLDMAIAKTRIQLAVLGAEEREREGNPKKSPTFPGKAGPENRNDRSMQQME